MATSNIRRTFGVRESPLLRLPHRVRIRCYSVRCQPASCNRLRGGLRVHLRAPSAHWFDGDGCPSDGLQVGGESIARGGNINWLTWICLNRLAKTADSRGMCTILLGSGPAVHNFFSAEVLAYQARSGTGSVDKIEQHRFPRQRGEVNLLGIGRIAE